MRHARNLFAAVPVFLAALAVARPASAQDYEVKVKRVTKAGEVYKLDVTFKEARTITVKMDAGEPQVNSDEYKVVLVGEVKVLEVSDRGEEKKISVKVEKAEATPAGGQPSPLVPPGATLVVAHDGKQQTATVEGGPALEPQQAAILNNVLKIDDPESPDDDATFNPKGRVKVGDRWEADKEKLLEGMKKSGLPMTKENVSGSVTLVEVKKVAGVDAMVLRGEVTATLEKGSEIPAFPPGMKVVDGKLAMSIDSVQPVDVTQHSMTALLTVNTDLTVARPPGGNGPQQITIKGVSTRDAKMEYKK